jgi:hypothetical protein
MSSSAGPLAGASGPGESCPPLAAAPWLELGQGVDADAIPGFSDFVDSFLVSFRDRMSGWWWSKEDYPLALVIGLVDPTEADLDRVVALAAAAGLSGVTVVVQPVPVGRSDLVSIQRRVDSRLSNEGIEFTSSVRPDTGVVEVGVFGIEPSVLERFLQDSAEECRIRVFPMTEADRYRLVTRQG